MNSRIAKIKSQLIEQKLDAILISSPANLFYLSGFVCLAPSEREAYLLVTKTNIFLVTSPLYAGDSQLPGGIKLEKTIHSSHEEVVSNLLEQNKIKSLGIEEDFLSVAEFHELQTDGVIFKRVNLSILRWQKDDEEVENIEKACKIGDQAFEFILDKIKPEVLETEIATELELFVRKKGAIMSFPTIIGFGKNAAIPHHITSADKLKSNNFVLLDFGVKVNNYCSDMTRTVYVGNPSTEEKKMYITVLEAQKKAIDYIISNSERSEQSYQEKRSFTKAQDDRSVQASQADKIARDYIVSQGFPSFPHTLGHGIGLEVHESPSLSANSKSILTQGMVFSIEPGIYLHTGRHGLHPTGVRIEDLMTIEKKGPRLLTNSPKELITL